MKPLAEIVADIEADKRAGYPLEIPKADLLRLCAAFRAAEKMRDACYADNSGQEYKPRCADCNSDMWSKHADGCSFKEWDRVTGGDDR